MRQMIDPNSISKVLADGTTEALTGATFVDVPAAI